VRKLFTKLHSFNSFLKLIVKLADKHSNAITPLLQLSETAVQTVDPSAVYVGIFW